MYRDLSLTEIEQLKKQGCKSKDWSLVKVAEDFLPDRVRDSSFSGNIFLGRFERVFELKGGICKRAGIRNVAFHNVTVGNNCYIENIHNYIANYVIGDECFIENVDAIYVKGFSTFGNGVKANVLNETGGREIHINDKLSAHIAYFSALYRHRGLLTERLHELCKYYSQKHGSDTGTIGSNCQIINTGKIEDVKIGENCVIEGASVLENGSINSTNDSPVYIGTNVRAKDFIISSGSRLDTGCTIERCFIGQSCTFANDYMAVDSLFFANCHGENGEACSIFAGPFTVSHHKGSLLIAGLFSFMNAGSGSNQSNHMYKLGPIHQGIMERGAKTASDSYILWPAHIGAFSLVMGRHVFHSDTSNLPFSYLIEKKNTTFLSPGVNLRSVGTIRDAQKWPKRDSRNGSKLDMINYNLLSPYTIQKMFNGIDILNNLVAVSGKTTDIYSFQSTKITNSSLHRGLEYYNIAITKFLGNSLIKRLENYKPGDSLYTYLKPSTQIGSGDWLDISGLIAPKSEIENLLKMIEDGQINRIGDINDYLSNLHSHYYEYEWTWAYSKIESFFGVELSKISNKEVIEIVERWKEAVVKLDKLVYEDAKKEFSLAVMTSFGADGSDSEKAKDFIQVRGCFENNPFVVAVLEHIKVKSDLGNELISRLKKKLT